MSNIKLKKGTVLMGKYALEECISSSKSCNIYIAEDKKNEKKVIIKELFDEAIDSKYRSEALKKFNEELAIYKNLETGEKIVKIIDNFASESAVYAENKQFIVMEHVKGKTLRQIKEEKKENLSPEEVGTWISELSDLFVELSNKEPSPVLYYLSPDHIMITDEGKVKVINYGLGRFFRSGPFKSNQYMGIAGYAAPEQYGIKAIDTRADIFGLGAVIYYMLTEDDPEKHPLNFSPVRQLNPSVSMQLARLISKCVQMKAEDRFQNFEELKEKVNSITLVDAQVSSDMVKKKEKKEGTSTGAKKKVLGKTVNGLSQNMLWTLEKHLPIKQIASIGGIVLVIALIAFAAVYYIMSGPKFPEKIIYATQLDQDYIEVIDANKKEPFKTIKAGETRGKILYFDDRLYINGTVSNIIVINAKKAELEDNIKIGADILDMVITRDGKSIFGSNTRNGEVIKIDRVGKTIMTSISAGSAPAGLALSDNEHYLYVANFKSNDISVIDIIDNTNELTIKDVGEAPKKLLSIPGKKLIYCANWTSGDVTVINSANNTIVQKVPVGKQPNDLLLSPDKKKIYVSNRGSSSISIIDIEDNNSVTEINLPGIPSYMSLSPDRKEILISTSNKSKAVNNIISMDINTNEITDEISTTKPATAFIMINTE